MRRKKKSMTRKTSCRTKPNPDFPPCGTKIPRSWGCPDPKSALEKVFKKGLANTIGHLSAGLVHLSRTGDDTSGKEWERTLKMGVNTLAFRLPQHKAFFAVDADCAGITRSIDWTRNAEWVRLLAHSGTPFFASISPDALDARTERELKKAMHAAARQDFHAEPVDWQSCVTPAVWKINGKRTVFDWYPEDGMEII